MPWPATTLKKPGAAPIADEAERAIEEAVQLVETIAALIEAG